MPTDYRQYLQPETVSKLKGMELRARLVVEGFIADQSPINALKRLGSVKGAPAINDSMAIAKISSNRRVSLWSTHPSLEDRIRRLGGA